MAAMLLTSVAQKRWLDVLLTWVVELLLPVVLVPPPPDAVTSALPAATSVDNATLVVVSRDMLRKSTL